MAIKTHMDSLVPSRDRYKKEITLLSHGYYAKTALPDGKITVFPWDSRVDEELLAQSRNQASKVGVLFRLLPKLCNLNGCPLDSMLVGDAMTVLYVSRSFRTNCTVVVKTVNKAGKSVSIDVSIPDQLTRVGEKSADYAGYDEITLPTTKDVVRIRPLSIGDEVKIEDVTDKDGAIPAGILRAIVPIISVGGGAPESVNELVEYWDALPVSDQVFIQEQEDLLSPHLSNIVTVVDDKTGEELSFELSLDREFFR